MNNKTSSLLGAALLLAAGAAFAQGPVPDTIWRNNDTTFQDMWNKSTLDTNTFWPHANNWAVENPGTDSAMITTNGLTRDGGQNWTNLTWKWQTSPAQQNFEIRFTWRMAANPSGNSGFNVRGYCGAGSIATLCNGHAIGYRVAGPQIDLGPTYTGDIWNSLAGGNLGPTAPTSCAYAAASAQATTFQDLEMRVRNDTMTTFFYPDGFNTPLTRIQCTQVQLTDARHVAATSPGLIALQYETPRISQFKNIKIRNLDAVPVSIHGVKQLKSSQYSILAGPRYLRVGVNFAGSYAVDVVDLSGRILHHTKGEGTAARQTIPLAQSGIYIVRISSVKGEVTRKVVVR